MDAQPEQAFLTLGEAARAVGRSKATLSKAVQTGRLSVHERTEAGFRIAASELFRAFPPNAPHVQVNGSPEQTLTPQVNSPSSALEREIELLREERARERHQLEAVIADLRRRLDLADEERHRLTLMLTDQRSKSEPSAVLEAAVTSPPSTAEGRFRRAWAALIGRA
jgi:hypothetical protein